MTRRPLPDESASKRVALLTFDPIGRRLAGSAIRVLGLAEALAGAGHRPVVLAPSLEGDGAAYGFPIHAFGLSDAVRRLRPDLESAQTAVLPVHALERVPWIARLRIPLVFDLYDPMLFQLLSPDTQRPLHERWRAARAHCSALNRLLRRGDFYLCANERQRDMWLGALATNGRVLPGVGDDPMYRHLIGVVPTGISAAPAEAKVTAPSLRTVLPMIGPRDTVIIGSGAMWEWQDTPTAVRAVGQLASRRSDIHLVLFGRAAAPDGERAALTTERVRALATELGVLGRQVHLIDEWLPYMQLRQWLREANGGLSVHRRTLESHFSFRSRVTEYIAAGLPILCSEGDVLAGLVRRHGLGVVIAEGDDAGFAAAFECVADDSEFVARCRAAIADVRPAFAWPAVADPLVRFCDNPRLSTRGGTTISDRMRHPWRLLRSLALRHMRARVRRTARPT